MSRRIVVVVVSVVLCLVTGVAGPVLMANPRGQAEKLKERMERRAGVRPQRDRTVYRTDPIRARVDKAKAQFQADAAAADAAALRIIQRQAAEAIRQGDTDRGARAEAVRTALESTKTFDAPADEFPMIARARQQWLVARQRAAAAVLSAFDRGIAAYEGKKDAASADALRTERKNFVREHRLAAADLPAGAVMHLSFEPESVTPTADGKSTTAADVSGAGSPGVLRGAEVIAEGRVGSAARFDGTAASVSCGNGPKLQSIAAGLTVAAFVRTDGPPAGSLIAKDDAKAPGGKPRGFALRLADSRPVFSVSLAGDRHEVRGPAMLPPGEWQHVAGTYDGQQLRLFVNGKPAASTKVATKGPIVPAPVPLVLGRQGAEAKGKSFAGALDEVMVFDRALTDAEIRQLAAKK